MNPLDVVSISAIAFTLLFFGGYWFYFRFFEGWLTDLKGRKTT